MTVFLYEIKCGAQMRTAKICYPILFDFSTLHFWQSNCMFSNVVAPPFEKGMM